MADQLIAMSPWVAASQAVTAEIDRRATIARQQAVEDEKRRQFDISTQYDREKLAEDARQFGISSGLTQQEIATRRQLADVQQGYREDQARQARDKLKMQVRVLKQIGIDPGDFGLEDTEGGGPPMPMPSGDQPQVGGGAVMPGAAPAAPIAPRALGPLLSVDQSPRSSGPMAGTSMMPQAQELTRLRSVGAPGFPTQGPTPDPAQMSSGSPTAAAPKGMPKNFTEVQRAALKAVGFDIQPHPDDTPYERGIKLYQARNNSPEDMAAYNEWKQYTRDFNTLNDQDPTHRFTLVPNTDIVFDTITRQTYRLPAPGQGAVMTPVGGNAGGSLPVPREFSGDAAPVAGAAGPQGAAPARGAAPAASGIPGDGGGVVQVPMGAPPTGPVRADAIDALSGTASMDTIRSLYKDEFVGPVAGRAYRMREQLGEDSATADAILGPLDATKSQFYQAVQASNDQLTKLMSGVAVNPTEMARIQREYPDVIQPPTVFKARLEQTRVLKIKYLKILIGMYPELAREGNQQLEELIAADPKRASSGRGAAPAAPAMPAGQGAASLDEIRKQLQEENRRRAAPLSPVVSPSSPPPQASAPGNGAIPLSELRRQLEAGR